MKTDDKAFLELINSYRDDKPLTEKDIKQMERWKFAHDEQVNNFKHGRDLVEAIMSKYNVSMSTAYNDIANSNKYFITEQMIDKDYWRGLLLRWQLKGLKLAYDNNKERDFNAAIRNLYLILGLHKKDNPITPGMLKESVFNFWTDVKKLGIPEVEEADIIELIEEVTLDQNITSEQKQKLYRDAGISRNK